MVLLTECSYIAIQASFTHISKYAASLCCPNAAVTLPQEVIFRQLGLNLKFLPLLFNVQGPRK